MPRPPSAPIAAPDNDRLAAIGARVGVSRSLIRPLPQGEANHTYALGDDLVLRIPRDDGALLDDLRKEARIIPVVGRAGLPVPAVVDWDDSRDLVPVPFIVQRRIDGTELDRTEFPDRVEGRSWYQVGSLLARLHHLDRATVDGTDPAPATIPVDLPMSSPSDALPTMIRAGRIDEPTGSTVAAILARLAPCVPGEVAPVLIHGDIAGRNILVDPATGDVTGLIDWGDAAWADPAQDFAKLPLPVLLVALEGYLAGTDQAAADLRAWQARAVRYHLEWGIAAAHRDPTRERLRVVLRFIATTTDTRWHWLR